MSFAEALAELWEITGLQLPACGITACLHFLHTVVSGQLEQWGEPRSGAVGWPQLARKCPQEKEYLSDTSEQAKSCSSLKASPYCFLLQQTLCHNRVVMNMVGHSGWPGTSAPGLLCSAQPGSFREALLPRWGEPSRLLGIQQLLACCLWPIF